MAHFIFEQHTELYFNTVREQSQKKNVLEAKRPAVLLAPPEGRPGGVKIFLLPAENTEGDEIYHHQPQPNQADLRPNLG